MNKLKEQKGMNWLEVIHFRANEHKTERLEQIVQHLIDEAKQDAVRGKIIIYRHTLVDSDLSIHLHSNSKTALRNGSEIGLRIASALKEFGMVNHSVWSEVGHKQELNR